MLSFAENIVLLAMDPITGHLRPMPERALNYALAGALLMELVAHNRIQAYTVYVKILDKTSIGKPLLDAALARMAGQDTFSLTQIIDRLAGHTQTVLDAVIKDLEDKKILGHQRFSFWGITVDEQYPLLDKCPHQAVLKRIRTLVLDKGPANAQDVGMLALIHACDLEPVLFNAQEINLHKHTIAQYAQLDPIGKAVEQAIRNVQHALHTLTEHAGL